MTAIAQRPMGRAAFFDWLEHQERRYELVDGDVVMLPHVTRNHHIVTMNIAVAIANRLDRTRYNICTGDFAVETGADNIRYADVMVELAGGSGRARSTDTAIVLIEVLSPSSIQRDFNEKLHEYTALDACRNFLIFDQDVPRGWQWTRAEGKWPELPTVVEGLDRIIQLHQPTCNLPMGEIFANVV